VRFGTRLYGTEPAAILAKATKAEELGFDSIWRGDHLILPAQAASPYPHAVDGGLPFPVDAPILDVLTVLAWIAQATSRIRLATGILVLPLREPVAVARAVQTLDILSGGRAILGVGSGWLAEEFTLVGADFASRGVATEEGIDLIKALWTQAEPTFAGRLRSVEAARFEPKPVQRPHPPIVVGGESETALRRAARLCDGWYGHRPTPADAAAKVTCLRQLLREAGRDRSPFEITVRVLPDVSRDDVRRYDEAGVDRLVAEIGRFEDTAALEDVETMERFAERVMSG